MTSQSYACDGFVGDHRDGFGGIARFAGRGNGEALETS